MSHSSPTVLVVTRTFVARAQSSGGGTQVRRQTRAAGVLVDGVEAAAQLGDRLRGPVWLLTDELFTQAISVAAGAVRGLPEAEVSRALAFEASTLSGFGAEQSVVGWKSLPSEGREAEFWVSQIALPELEQALLAVRRAGGKLVGIVHPAGVPAPLRPREGAWRRLEVWSDLSTSVEREAGGAVVVRAGRGDLSRRSPQENAPSEILVAGSRTASPRAGADVLRLDDEATLQAWCGAWMRVLKEKAPPVPVLRPPDRVLSSAFRIGLGIAFAAVMLTLAVIHYVLIHGQQAKLKAELIRSQEPLRRFSDLKRSVDVADKEAAQLRSLAAPVGTGWSRIPARIMEVMASRCPPGLVVDELDAGWDRTVIRGLCKDPLTADRLAEGLGQDLGPDHFRVSPPTKALQTETTGQYEFEIEVVSSWASSPAASTAASPGTPPVIKR